MERSTFFIIVFISISCVLFIGCTQIQREGQESAGSIEPKLTADVIAQYYKANGSAYITRQRHSFNPTDGHFQMASQEPTGKLEYTLKQNQYTESKQKTAVLSDMPSSFCTQELAAALFYSFCAGGDLLDTTSLVSGENIKLEGRWYQPQKTKWPSGTITITLLRSLDTNRIEMVQLDNSTNGLSWLLRSYNLRYSKELEKNIPRKIDVFDARDGIASKLLMIQFEYQDIQLTKNSAASVVNANSTAK